MARITVDLISNKEFSSENHGYNRKEVDEFLDEICDEMERMESEIKDLRQKTTVTREIPAPVASAPSSADEGSLREVLQLAVQLKEETLRKAREDAEAIRVKAEAEATEKLDGLSDERDSLTKQVDQLRAAAADYRRKFEQLLQAQQDAMDKASDLFD